MCGLTLDNHSRSTSVRQPLRNSYRTIADIPVSVSSSPSWELQEMPQWPWRKSRPGVDEYGRSPLWHHAANGDLPALEAALDGGADPSAPDKDGYTSLHVAAQNGHREAIALLLRAGADPNWSDRHGNGPLWTACHAAIKASATADQVDIISRLLAAGASPNQTNKAGRSPQHWRQFSPRVEDGFRQSGR